MNTKHILSILLLLVIFTLNSCIQDTNNYLDAPVNPDKQSLLDLVNEVRSSGCYCDNSYYAPVGEVNCNALLEEAAQIHSDDMNHQNDLNHTGSDGSSAGDRLDRIGYSWSTYGENIAAGYASEEEVIAGWLDSPGHCKNIMNANMTEMGVATSGAYWTQILAAP